MKKLFIILIIAIINSTSFNLNAANLTLGNSDEVTLTTDATYGVITLNNGSKLIIPSGVTITATTLNVKNSAEIDLNGTLNITGDVDVKNAAVLTINNTGVMAVDGDFNANGGASIINDGVVGISGDYSGPTPTGGGSLTDQSGTVQNPLPVEFGSLVYETENGNVILNWFTNSELNNDYFTIKTSKDLTDWTTVDMISGVGNSTIVNDYEYSFIPEYSGQVYVQLSQTDYDGTTEVLKVIAINVKGGQFKIYPNPMREGQRLQIKGITGADNVKVFNSAMVPVENINNLERGYYYVIINDSNVQKLIVK